MDLFLRNTLFVFKWPNWFNIGLITPLGTSLSDDFDLLFKYSLIFMNMQIR